MQLFDDIISLLSDEKSSLASALLKTKVLMHLIGHKDIDGWLNSELNGYPSNGAVPEYRIVSAQLTGTVENMARRYTNVTLATLHLPDEFRERFCKAHLGHSVAELQEFATAKEGSVGSAVPPEFYGILGQVYDNAYVTSARSLIGSTQIAGVLVEIRSRLLEFVLNLQDKIGDVPEAELKKAAAGVNTQGLFSSAIFGSNTTIIVGNQNTTTVTNTINEGNIAQLEEVLREAGVPADDLVTLNRAISDDGDAPKQTKSFGPKVAHWIGNMMQKAASGGWQIGVAAAGNLLSGAISNYYGLGSN
ncbi:AbiTii domain-containing protein [Paraburkholderia adhaesiva]|uniref:AbiTii domain-containing protein n=1 Tax=Paraburkholderia adhaesiva TaxID=2883244 RepID=UPI001F2D341F|nr:hypothetical protein [Paraburkholderia adhaesiva]